ncbi:MAG: RHS repeat domain-containing protein [Bacillota bacterium]|nr:RHS repeat domain-containing protein [Bacillota bacterium]
MPVIRTKGLIGNENAKAYGVFKKGADGLELPNLNIETETFDYLGQSTVLHKVYSEHGSPMNEYYQAGGEVVAQKMFGNKGRISPAKEATLDTNGGLMYYEYDGLGTVTALRDRHGDTIEDYRYDAFGNLQTGITSPYNLKGYTGHLYDYHWEYQIPQRRYRRKLFETFSVFNGFMR